MLKRVCRSTAAGEVLSLGDGHSAAMWLRRLWQELTGQLLQVRLVTDSMSTLKNVLTTKLPEGKRLRIDLAALRQGLLDAEFVLTWVPGRANLADPLTQEADSEGDRLKPCDSMKRPLLDALRSNCTNFKGINHITKTQADVTIYLKGLG